MKQLLPDFHTLILALLIGFSAALWGQSTVQVTASRDNTLYETGSGDISNGMGEYFFAGTNNQTTNSIRRGLIYFDIAGSVPAGATIQSVTLKMYMSRTNGASGSRDITLHKTRRDWGEGFSAAGGEQGQGAQAATGDATWLHTFYTTETWTTPGGDFQAAASGSNSVNGEGFYTWASTPEMVADLQSWLDDPSGNYGWTVLGDETESGTSKRFSTHEITDIAEHPTLTITYDDPTGIGDQTDFLPQLFSLDQNYPNPFNPGTEIRFQLERAAPVLLEIYNLAGQVVATPLNGTIAAGEHKVTFNAAHLVSGVYFYRLQVGRAFLTRRMVLLK